MMEFEFAKSRAMRVCLPTCLRASMVYVPTYLRANVPKGYQLLILTCHKACQCFNLVCQCAKQHANFSTWRCNVPKDVSIIQICIVYKNCIIFHHYTSCHIEENCMEFLLFQFFLLFS